MPKPRKVARSAKSGRFVTMAEARRRPATTVVETVGKARKRKVKR